MIARATLLAVFIASFVAGPAWAQTESANCWEQTEIRKGREVTVVYCSIGGSVTDYNSWTEAGSNVGVLSPDVGYDATGECWFYTTRATNWVLLGIAGDGSANLGWDPDGIPGGPIALDVTVRACESEPSEGENIENLAWQVIDSYTFEVPDPSFNPDGIGVTGLATFIAVAPPPPFTDSVVSPITGRTVTVEISVAAVVVDWGDSTIDTWTSSAYPLLSGYPDGIAQHTYETKAFYDIGVDYEWFIRWNVDGGPWTTIVIPDTEVTIPYRVDEIVSRNSG